MTYNYSHDQCNDHTSALCNITPMYNVKINGHPCKMKSLDIIHFKLHLQLLHTGILNLKCKKNKHFATKHFAIKNAKRMIKKSFLFVTLKHKQLCVLRKVNINAKSM